MQLKLSEGANRYRGLPQIDLHHWHMSLKHVDGTQSPVLIYHFRQHPQGVKYNAFHFYYCNLMISELQLPGYTWAINVDEKFSKKQLSKCQFCPQLLPSRAQCQGKTASTHRHNVHAFISGVPSVGCSCCLSLRYCHIPRGTKTSSLLHLPLISSAHTIQQMEQSQTPFGLFINIRTRISDSQIILCCTCSNQLLHDLSAKRTAMQSPK